MFTGLVTDTGRIEQIEITDDLARYRVLSRYAADEITLGASIMHSGVCLTVVETGPTNADGFSSWWDVEAVPETLSRTILGKLTVGSRVNLEQSLRVGDELGGHFVFGHVDGVGEVMSVTAEGESYRIRFRPPADIQRFFAAKGSVAIDGVSLTVAAAHDDSSFEVAVIPHTWSVTTLGELQTGSNVNIEVDMLARYVDRLISQKA